VTSALRRGVATLVALVALLALVPAALAADGITLRSLDTSRLPQVRAVVALDKVDPDTPPTFRVLENDAQVGTVEVGSAATATSYALVVDTSQSMKGRALRSAMEGAKTFLATVKDGDRVALIGFGAAVLERQPFTDDQTALNNAVNGLDIDAVQGTALEDAIMTGARALASEDPKRRRVMIVLTDGDNVVRTSAATEEQALDATKKAQVTAYTIGIASDDFAPAALQRLAAATGGTYGEGTTKELSTVYAQIAEDLARTFVLTFYSSHSGKVALTIDAGGAMIARTNYAGGAPVRVTTGEGVVPSSVTHANWSVPALAGITLLLFVIGGFTVLRPRPRKTLTQRLEPYADSRTRALKVGDLDSPSSARGMLKSFAVVTERLLGQLKVWKRMATTIERADLPLKTAELFYMMVGAALFLGFVFGLGFGLPMPVTLGIMAIGFLLPYGFVKLKARQRCKAFDNQLPDILISMAASLKAGHSFNQAMETTIKEGADPAAKEFGRVSNEIRLGRASDEALERMAERLGSSNFRFVVMAVNVQRQVGGSMAELLDGVGETVRQRQQFLRKVKALCAMGRMSAYTLIALPIMMGGAISAINPSYMKPLFVTSTGHMLLIIAVVSISFGALVLKKIVSFRV
jgi:tight adherence protein B